MYKDISLYKEKINKIVVHAIEKLPKGSKVIELGCGDGNNVFQLNKLGLLKKIKYYAIDISPEQIKSIKKIAPINVKCIQSNVCDLRKIKKSSFDFVLSTQVLEHVEDDNKMISEVYRILKKDGEYYIDTVIKKWYGWYFYRNSNNWVLHPEHIREYPDINKLKILFTKNKLKISIHGCIQISFPIEDIIIRIINKIRGSKISSYKSIFNINIPIPGYFTGFIYGKK